MPQRKQLTWAELRVGLFVLVGLAVLAAGIFYVTGAGILGPKYRVKTLLPEVSGLAKGAGRTAEQRVHHRAGTPHHGRVQREGVVVVE